MQVKVPRNTLVPGKKGAGLVTSEFRIYRLADSPYCTGNWDDQRCFFKFSFLFAEKSNTFNLVITPQRAAG